MSVVVKSAVFVFAAEIVTALKSASAEPVILALVVTGIDDNTRYAVPISELCTEIRELLPRGVLIGTIPTNGVTASIVTVFVDATERLPAASAA